MAEQEYMHPPSDAGNARLCEKLEVYTRHVNERCTKAVRKDDSCKFNKKQCEYLALKFEGLVNCSRLFLQAAQCEPCSSGIAEKWDETFKLMLILSKQIDDFVQSCCKEESWIQTAMTMTNTSEYVSSLGCNVEICKVACEGFLEERGGTETFTAVELQRITRAKLDEMCKIEVENVKEYAEEDLVTLRDKVTAELTLFKGERLEVAHYLLRLLSKVQGRPTEDKMSLLDSIFKWRVLVDRKLGTGATATVYAATWLGMVVAKKVFQGLDNSYFEEEVTNLAPLRHPNITSMFCCKKTNRDSSIIMELMDGDFNKLLHNRGEENNDSSPFPILEAVDIMLQVGEGVNYLHNNRIVHRDLKSHNILVKRVKVEELDYGYIHAKVTDFGISIKKDSTARLTSLEPNVGTSRYMPPEVINLTPSCQKSPSESVNSLSFPFKCDTYSYGMLCYEILTGHVPFYEEEIFSVTVKENVKKGDRPELRDDLPPMLKALIESCWSGDPKKRPKFNLICSQLRYLKYLLMTGADKETHEFAAAEFEAAAGESCREEVAREQQAAAAKSPEEAAVANEAREQEAATERREEALAANEMGSPDVVNTFLGATVGSGGAVVKVQGPWGSPTSGREFFDMATSITGIELRYSEGVGPVGLFKVTYELLGKTITGESYLKNADHVKNAGRGQILEKIKFQPEIEYIKQITGFVTRQAFKTGETKSEIIEIVSSLTFYTNLKKYGPFGVERGTKFASDIGSRVIGFYGRAGYMLDSLGVITVPDV